MRTSLIEHGFITGVEDIGIRPATLGAYLVNRAQTLGVDGGGIGQEENTGSCFGVVQQG